MSERYYNTLEIIGDEAQIKALKEFIRGTQDELGREIYFDFNKVVKMPEELEIEYEKLVRKDLKTKGKGLDKKEQECMASFSNWFYENWIMKWPPFNQEIEDDSTINYTTINGRGLIVIEKLSQLFPEIIFAFISIFETPDDDHIYHIKNGEILLACECDYYFETILSNIKKNNSLSKSENKIIESVLRK